jgi:hypothetical protein
MDKISRRHVCGALLAVLAVASLPVDARNLAGAARAALQRKAAQEAAQKAAVQGKPKDVIIRRSQHPAAAEHIEHAQRHGQPTVLHVDRAGADARRRASIGTVNRETRPAKWLRPRRVPPGLSREKEDPTRACGSSRQATTAGPARPCDTRPEDVADGQKIRVLVTD